MRWPGTGDPRRRKKTVGFLIKLLILGVSVGVTTFVIMGYLGQGDPIKVCIEDRNTPYKLSVTLELYVDGKKADIPANIGFGDSLSDELLASDCQRSMYTLTNDGTIYAEWEGAQDKALVAKVRAGDEANKPLLNQVNWIWVQNLMNKKADLNPSAAELLDWVTSGQIEAMRK